MVAISTLSAGNGASFSVQVMVFSVTVIVPAMLKVPKIGTAGSEKLHRPSSNAPFIQLENLIPRIKSNAFPLESG